MRSYLGLCVLAVVAAVIHRTECNQQLYNTHYQYDDPQTAAGGVPERWDLVNSRFSRPKCVPIPANLTLCRNLEYTDMRLPNLLEHDTLQEVTQQSSSWKPLLGLRCHDDTQLFLCSLFAPVCLERLEAAVWPCRSLCQAVQAGCEKHMVRYGFPWPEMLRCDKFPDDNDLCIGVISDQDADVCAACQQAYTFEAIGDNFCSSHFVMKVRIRSKETMPNNDLKLSLKKKRKILKTENVSRRQLRQSDVYIANGGRCNCTHLNPTAASEQQADDHYLVMGHFRDRKYYVSFLHPYQKTRGLRDVLKAMRAGSICEGGVHVLNAANTAGEAENEDDREGAENVVPAGSTASGRGGRTRGRGKNGRRNRGDESSQPTQRRNNRERSGGNNRQRGRGNNRARRPNQN